MLRMQIANFVNNNRKRDRKLKDKRSRPETLVMVIIRKERIFTYTRRNIYRFLSGVMGLL